MTKMTIGNRFKEARQNKKISHDEVHQKTKIHPSVLLALEEDRFDAILNPTYIRSFLREYATYLGLDVEKILEEYNKQHPKGGLQVKETPGARDSWIENSVDTVKIGKIVKPIIVFIISALILFIVLKGAGSIYRNVSKKISLARKEAKIKKAALPKPVLKKKRPKKNKISMPKKSVNKVVKNVALPKPKKSKLISKPAEKVSIPRGVKLQLSVTVTNDMWMQLRVDGKIIFQNVLKKGSSETWEADEGFNIWTGRAEAMQLSLNGYLLGSPGEGVIKDIVINRQGIKK